MSINPDILLMIVFIMLPIIIICGFPIVYYLKKLRLRLITAHRLKHLEKIYFRDSIKKK
jgi:hypothetical protein